MGVELHRELFPIDDARVITRMIFVYAPRENVAFLVGEKRGDASEYNCNMHYL